MTPVRIVVLFWNNNALELQFNFEPVVGADQVTQQLSTKANQASFLLQLFGRYVYGMKQSCCQVHGQFTGIHFVGFASTLFICFWYVRWVDYYARHAGCPKTSAKRKAKRTTFIHTVKMYVTIVLAQACNQTFTACLNTKVTKNKSFVLHRYLPSLFMHVNAGIKVSVRKVRSVLYLTIRVPLQSRRLLVHFHY